MPGLGARPQWGEEDTPAIPTRWEPDAWRSLVPYLYGVDLYNHGYWWECHEVLEALWHAAGRKNPQARFIQGLIHLAASNLNWHRGHDAAARRQANRGIERVASQSGRTYMGIGVDDLVERVRASIEGDTWNPPPIRLDFEDPGS